MSFKKLRLFNRKEKKAMLCLMLGSMMALTTGFTPNNLQNVRILVDGQTIETHTTATNPEGILDRAGIQLNEKDEYYAKKTGNGTEIIVQRAVPAVIEYNGTKEQVLTSRATVGEALSDLGYNVNDYQVVPGLDTKVQENINIKLEDSAAVKAAAAARKAEEERLRNQIIETSRGAVRYTHAMTMEASAYLPTDGGGSGVTASGMRAQRGVVAVDPRVIPLGTRLYIPGYGDAIAADTGGAINGHMIDLCMESYGEAMQFGRRHVTVYVLQ